MATQTILFAAASGLTITAARLFLGTSDTIAATAAATEQTNAKGWYSAAYTDLAAGLYRVVALDTNGTTLAIWWVRCAGGNSTAFATETPDATEWTLARAGYMDLMLQAQNGNQRTVQITGSNHIAADVHAFQADVITAAATAADFVTEIQFGLALQSTSLTINNQATNIQSRLPAALVSGRMDSSVGAMAANTLTASALATDAVTEIQSGLSTLTAAQVNAEVLDVLATDLFAELAAVPAASSSLKDKIAFLFMLARNKVTQSSNTQTLFADNTTTPVAAAATSDVAGTFTRGEFA